MPQSSDTVAGSDVLLVWGAVGHGRVVADLIESVGGARVDAGAIVNTGAVVDHDCVLEDFVGTGAVVICDVPRGATVVGNPGRIVSARHRDAE